MADMVLGVGEFGVCAGTGGLLKTFALGSCVAVCIYDLRAKVVGMVHVALPHSSTNLARAKVLPGYFVDTGIQILMEHLAKVRGPDRKGLIVKICGGANVMRATNVFDIGKRNIQAVTQDLMRRGMPPASSDIGGSISRTVSIEVDTGCVVLNSPGRSKWTI